MHIYRYDGAAFFVEAPNISEASPAYCAAVVMFDRAGRNNTEIKFCPKAVIMLEDS